MPQTILEKTEKVFIQSYIETMLWSSSDDQGNPLDNSQLVFAVETLKTIIKDCKSFISNDLFNVAVNEVPKEGYSESVARVAHDFWLTRNRHGAGFWDGDYSKGIGEKLTDFSHTFGELYLYVGDDGKLYF